jgi:CheY-like chemotaxis protein
MENISARIGEVRVAERTRERPERPKYVDARRLEALMALAAQASARQLLASATEAVVDLLGERGSAVLVDAGGSRVVLATHAPDLTNLPVEMSRYPEIANALETGNVVAIEDVHTDPLLAKVRELIPGRLGSVAVVPMIVGDHRLGVLMAQSASNRAFTAEAVATASLIGRFTALVLEARLGRRVGVVFTGTHDAFPVTDTTKIGIGTNEPTTVDSRKRVLLVDDDSGHGSTLAEALRHGGYVVDIALDGAEGVRRAQERRPDVILLGVCLPVLDGISAAERLREDERTRSVPIIFLTGVDDLLTRASRATFEKVDYLPKSQALPDLLARVERSIKS